MIKVSKIKAFTLQELVIVMVITMIVVSLTFTVLQLVQRQMYAIQQNFETKTEINLLECGLWADFNKAGSAYYSSSEKKLVFNQVLDTVTYHFDKDKIVRDRDTLSIVLSEMTLFNLGKEVEAGPIDALSIGFSKKIRGLHLFVYKQKDASQYFK